MSRLRLARARTSALTIGGSPTLTATQGVAYGGFTPTVTGGSGGNTFSMMGTPLPTGMSMDGSTGAVTGTPTTAATISGIIQRVTDSFGHTDDLAWGDLVISTDVGSYDDGSSVAKSGPAQHPTVLDFSSSTNELGISLATRPSWSVAGVDFRVGPSSTQVYKVLGVDALPAGFSYNTSTKFVYVPSGGGTLDGWDLTGYTILSYAMASPVTITNNKWVQTNTAETAFYTDATANSGLVEIAFNDLDCNKVNSGSGSIIHRKNGGPCRTYVHHNYVKNAGADFVNNIHDFDDTRMFYNVLKDFCWLASNHSDGWQEVTFNAIRTMSGVVFRGNLIIQSAADPTTHLPGFFNSILSHGDGANGCCQYDTYMDHNTIIGIGITGHDSPAGYVGVCAFGCILQGFGFTYDGKTDGLYVNNNYAYTDYNPAYPSLQGFYSGPWKIQKTANGLITNVAIQNNYQMRDGSALEEVFI